jgi:serine/threonine protein kinase
MPAPPQLDVWSLGATTYDLLVGHAPYQDEDETLTREQERAALLAGKKVGYPTWMSDAAVTFLKAALRNEPDSRPSVQELLRHPWLS